MNRALPDAVDHGQARTDSDIDLLVVMPGVAHRRHAAAEMHAALRGIPIAVDIVVATPEDVASFSDVPGTILQPALAEGRTIYAA